MKTLKSFLLFIVFTIISFFVISSSNNVVAVSTDQYVGEVQLGGDTIGIQMKTKVEIVGKYDIIVDNEKIKPWENSDIVEGDYIYSVDNNLIYSNEDLNNYIKSCNNECVLLTLIRNNEMINTSIKIVKNKKNENSIGLYVKDHLTGVGTLTFINPRTNIYGALGHSVNDALNDGNLYVSSIKGVKKAIKGVPGEKFATLSPDKIGTVETNSSIGIFGKYLHQSNNESINILKRQYIKTGPAKIVTVVNGNLINEYDVEIIEVANQDNVDIKGIKFRITDQNLINETGGIIQGMSGSPIVQNGCLVGAVSHVIVNDPLCGFGVFAEWMYYETEK